MAWRLAALTGSANADEIGHGPRMVRSTTSNHAGGILGGILDRAGRFFCRPLRGQADLVDPDATPHDRRGRAKRPKS